MGDLFCPEHYSKPDDNISPYSVQMRGNKDQKNSEYGQFLTQSQTESEQNKFLIKEVYKMRNCVPFTLRIKLLYFSKITFFEFL